MLSFYIHIPYCIKRCGYCDFNTYAPDEVAKDSGFIDSLIAEVSFAARTQTSIVPTIFFGGGTPSLMSAVELGRVIDLIKQRWELTSDCEITMEANPDSLKNLSSYREVGINRLSIGMQSADTKVLKVLDRTHNPENVERVIKEARKAGFENISVDLIYGVPGETVKVWERTVETALSYGLDHLSAYSLIIEPNTKLANQIKRGEITKPDDDLAAEMYLVVDELADKAGLNWYELSNWGEPAKHNLVYWQNQNWWGLGPGAHSHLNGVRWWNVKHPNTYKERLISFESPMQDRETLTTEEKQTEEIMLQIRLREGLDLAKLNGAQIEKLKQHPEEISITNNRAILTLKGRLVADRLVRELVL
jgi:oxygen-independent coproporphyrinogen-3 oxidase